MRIPEPCLCGAEDCKWCGTGHVHDCIQCGDTLRDGENFRFDVTEGNDRCLPCLGHIRCPLCGEWAYPEDGLEASCGWPLCVPGENILPAGGEVGE